MGYKISLKKGNLLEAESDFIVNPSNTKLILGSGVSMVFKRHCGRELQEEMYKKLHEIDKPLQQGDVVATSSAKATNFKYALHVAVMNYNKNIRNTQKLPTLQVIEDALQNIEKYLIWYTQTTKSSIKLALPLMGCGIGGLNKKAVIQIYQKFFSKEIMLKCKVIIYGYQEEDYIQIKKYLK